MDRLKGKVAIVTGGASGIGAATVALFVAEGATVIVADISEAPLQKVQASAQVLPKILDVTSEEGWEKLTKDVFEEFGSIDILINNAGMASDKGMNETTEKDWMQLHKINSWGAFLGIKHVVPYMKKAEKGAIVNTVSYTALIGAGINAYTASKGSARALSKAAAVELGSFNIRVNSIYPGVIQTPMSAAVSEHKEMIEGLISATPLGRLGQAVEVANAILFLASDEATYITGAELTIDGGYSAQ